MEPVGQFVKDLSKRLFGRPEPLLILSNLFEQFVNDLSKRLLGHPKEGKAVCLLFIGQMYSFFYYLPEFHYRQMTHNAFLVSCFESKRTNIEVMYDEDEL